MYDREGKIQDRREMLRVKLKSLAAEAVIIRQEEQRMLRTRRGKMRRTEDGVNWLYEELRNHRRGTVAATARLTHLAYGAIRGLDLLRMEHEGSAKLTEPEKKEVLRMCKQYGAWGWVAPDWMLPKEKVVVVKMAA